MNEQTGITTFLFTDIEGSTALWQANAAPMAVAVERHDAIVRRAIDCNSGTLIKMTGDGAFAVFVHPLSALLAAADLQRALRPEPSASEVALRVRCGVHLGEATGRDGDYVGSEVNRAARIMSVAYGGQVLVSRAVLELVRNQLPPGLSLRDLGEVRLKDMPVPERLYQLQHADLRTEFPPLRSIVPSNLPTQLTTLLGRDDDIVSIASLLEQYRLVTIVGAGGIGKTRLAQAVGHLQSGRFEDGVWWVDLTPVQSASHLVVAIGAIIGSASQSTENARSQLIASLRTRRTLFVIDNCEHVLDTVAELLQDILAIAPDIRWLLTSQQPVKLPDEHVYRLGTLPVPAPGTTAKKALEYGAIALMAQRITAADRRFAITDSNVEAAIDLCAQVDGIPLAIEMAAARVPVLGLDRVRTMLGERLRFLSAGHRTPLARHQTLHQALDWSHSLLSAPEQTTLRRLGVFIGGFTLELAQRVAADRDRYAGSDVLDDWQIVDALEGLVDKSMVQTHHRIDAGEPRYSLLETTRRYAQERLEEAGEREAAQASHAHTMATFAERAFAEHWTQTDAACVARMQPEIENLRNALRWSIDHDDADVAAAILGSTWPLFRIIDRQYEAQAWMNSAEPLLARATGVRAARALAAVVYVFANRGGDSVLRAAREAVHRYHALGDRQGLYFALAGLAYAGANFAESDSDAGRDARAALTELDQIEQPDWPARLRCWAIVARTVIAKNDLAARIEPLRAMYDLAYSVGATERALTAQANTLGVLFGLGRIDEGIELARTVIQSGLLGGERLGNVLFGLAEALAGQGKVSEARDFASEGARVLRRCNGTLEAFAGLASVALAEGRAEDAARLAGYAESFLVISGIERGAQVRIVDDISAKIDALIGVRKRQPLMSEGARMSEPQAIALALHAGPPKP